MRPQNMKQHSRRPLHCSRIDRGIVHDIRIFLALPPPLCLRNSRRAALILRPRDFACVTISSSFCIGAKMHQEMDACFFLFDGYVITERLLFKRLQNQISFVLIIVPQPVDMFFETAVLNKLCQCVLLKVRKRCRNKTTARDKISPLMSAEAPYS